MKAAANLIWKGWSMVTYPDQPVWSNTVVTQLVAGKSLSSLLPAFGDFTGCAEIEPAEEDRVWVVAEGRVAYGVNTGFGSNADKLLGGHPMRDAAVDAAADPRERLDAFVHGALADWFATRRLRAHVSITDEADYAASFVVVETRSQR